MIVKKYVKVKKNEIKPNILKVKTTINVFKEQRVSNDANKDAHTHMYVCV